ncbi:glycosyltransferase family 4 protein [Flavobacteriaceae bacterium]|nr:glycosyltransferase family 4 protein [Flavobacteriaceae bacterium]MDC0097775.1 glycosyltransferase family 4 protein [Flavobacteriaceae bacterium]
MNSLLIIGQTFPEPTTTAAGGRMLQLIEMFTSHGYGITFASSASSSEKSFNLDSIGVTTQQIVINDSSFDDFVRQLNPTIVLFDRFVTEEQFAWRVTQSCPKALKILDTEDLHFLRKARQQALKDAIDVKDANLFTETAKREIASILRCDLSLIISEFEMKLLADTFAVSKEILYYLPFMVTKLPDSSNFPEFEQRTNFMTIGNLLHGPNVDSVLYLKKEIWPLIKKQLPQAQLYIYGNYAPQHILELHNQKQGFYIMGWADSVANVMQKTRVCLAPLRFGAGLKGKLLDAMLYGTPGVTTSIGAEGMYGDLLTPGVIADTPESFAELSVAIYSDKIKWQQNAQRGVEIVKARYNGKAIAKDFMTRLDALKINLKLHRQSHFVGQILQHHSLQASKYLSKWIEEKNKV